VDLEVIANANQQTAQAMLDAMARLGWSVGTTALGEFVLPLAHALGVATAGGGDVRVPQTLRDSIATAAGQLTDPSQRGMIEDLLHDIDAVNPDVPRLLATMSQLADGGLPPLDPRAEHVRQELSGLRQATRLARTLGPLPAQLTLAHLLPLVQRTVAPDATEVTAAHVDGLVRGIRVTQSRFLRFRQPATVAAVDRLFRRAASATGGPNSRQNRAAELAALHRQLQAWGRPATDDALRALIAARRSYHPDPRQRGFTDIAADYLPMVADLLGRSAWNVDTFNDLMGLVSRVRMSGQRQTRQRLAQLATNLWPSTSPTTPPPTRRAALDAMKLSGLTEQDLKKFSEELPRFQYLTEVGMVSELAAWLNRATMPGLDNQLSEADLLQAMRWGVPNLFDEGLAFEVDPRRGGLPSGEGYTVRLFAAPVGAVDVKALQNVKIEQRVNAIINQKDQSKGATFGWYADGGAVVGGGVKGLFLIGGTFYIGGGGSTVRTAWQSDAAGLYKYSRPDKPAKAIEVPAVWWAVVTPKADPRRSTVVTWTDAAADPVTQKLSALVLPQEVDKFVDPQTQQVVNPQTRQLTSNEQLPLSGMHAVVEGLSGLDDVVAELRQRVGEDVYLGWYKAGLIPDIELFLSQDRIGALLAEAADAHASYGHGAPNQKPAGDSQPGWNEVPRILLQGADGSRVSLALTARITGTTPLGNPSPDAYAKYDDITVTSQKAGVRTERRRLFRTGGILVARFFGFLVNLRARYGYQRVGVRTFTTSKWEQHFRSLRSMQENRVLRVDMELAVHVSIDGRPDPVTVPVPAWAQVRVQTRELAAAESGTFDTAAANAKASRLSWWTPAQTAQGNLSPDLDFGVGYGRVSSVTGMAEIYNQVVPRLVSDGYLPRMALNPNGTNHWHIVMQLSTSGHELNRRGDVAVDNWRELVEFLSRRSFIHRIDDLMGAGHDQPGITLTLPHPRNTNTRVTLGVGGSITGTAAANRTDVKMPLNVLFSTYDWFHNRPKERHHDVQSEIGSVASPPLIPADVPPVGIAGNPKVGPINRRWRNWKAYTVRIGTTVMTYARTTGKTSRYALPATFQWRLYDDSGSTARGSGASGTASGVVQMWQPDLLAALPRNLPPLDTSGASPLSGLTPRAPLFTSGVPALRAELIRKLLDARGPSAWAFIKRVTRDALARGPLGGLMGPAARRAIRDAVWNGITPLSYKLNLTRALAPGGQIVYIGAAQGTVRTRPVGKVQVLGKFAGYSEVMQEKQAGEDRAADKLRANQWRLAGGYNTGVYTDKLAGVGTYANVKGSGHSQLDGRTQGAYRSLAGVAELYVVRFAVENTVLLENGITATTAGEVVMVLDQAEVDQAYANNPQQFVDVGQCLPGTPASQPPVQVRKPPRTLADGHFWEGVFTERIAADTNTKTLAEAVMDAAQELGGTDLKVKVGPLLVGLGVHMAELQDAGQSFTVDSGGNTYVLTLTAKAAGPARHVRDEPVGKYTPPRCVWLHNRSNDLSTTGDRGATTHSGLATGGSGEPLGTGTELGNFGTLTGSRTTERGRSRGTNLLHMDGSRPNGVSRFTQPVEFEWKLQRMQGLRAPAQVISDTFTDELDVHVPLDAATRDGLTPYTSGRRLNDTLPADVVIIGSHGMGSIARVCEPYAKRVRRGQLPGDSILTDIRLARPSTLAAMLRPGGVQFAGVGAGYLGDYDLDLSKHPVTVRAELGVPHAITRILQGEIEHYDHGTRIAANTNRTTTAANFDSFADPRFSVGVTAGPRVGLGFSGSRSRDAGARTENTEHRAWVRWTGPHFHIYVPITYTVVIDAITTTVEGAVTLVVDETGAGELGLTAAELEKAHEHAKANLPDP
jgi:hypothetical protein